MPKSSLTLVFLATTLFGASILGGCVRSRFIHRSPTDATTELSDTGLGVDQAHDILSIRPLDGKISDLWHHEEASDRDAIDLPAKDTAHDLPAKDTAHDLPAKDTAHDVFIDAALLPPSIVWAKSFGGTQNDRGEALGLSPTDTLVLTGYFFDSVDFGKGPLIGHGSNDFFIGDFNLATGDAQWTMGFGSTRADEAFDLAIDTTGVLYVTGRFTDTVDFGTGPLTSVGTSDIFVASYTAKGVIRWAKRFGGNTGGKNSFGLGIAVGATGYVAVTGFFSGTTDFGMGPLTAEGEDVFIVSFTKNGTVRWAKDIGGLSNDRGKDVAINADGNVLVTGNVYGVADFGKGPVADTGSLFVANYASNGNLHWVKRFDSGNSSNGSGPNAIAIDSQKNITVVGSYSNSADLGKGSIVSHGSLDVFVASYDTTGQARWVKTFGSTLADEAYAIETDTSGNLFVSGYFSNTIAPGTGTLTSKGGYDAFVVSYDTNGKARWGTRLGGMGNCRGRGIGIGKNGDIFVTGTFYDSFSTPQGKLMSHGSQDIFLVRLDPSP